MLVKLNHRIIMNHSALSLSRAHICTQCRSHVPSIPEKRSITPYEEPRRTHVVDKSDPAGWIRRAGALDICNSKSLPSNRGTGNGKGRV